MTDDLMITHDDGTAPEGTALPLRELALRGGDLHGEIMRRLSPLAGLPVEELVRHAEADLARLHERGRLTGTEVEQLREILRVVGTDSAPTDKLDRVDEVLRQVAESGAGPFALTIASIAADSSRGLVERGGAEGGVDAPSTAVVVVADVAGGIGGVFLGDELCGPVCGVMGGVAGAAGLSMLAQDHL